MNWVYWAQEDFSLVYVLRTSEELCGVFDLKKQIKAKSDCGLEGNSKKRQNIEAFSEEQSECVNFDVCVHLIYFSVLLIFICEISFMFYYLDTAYF